MSRVPLARIATLLLMVSCLATPAAAQSQQSPSTVDLAQRIQALEDRVRALQLELAALRTASAPATPVPAPQLVLPPQAEPSAPAPPAGVGADASTAQNLPAYAGASGKPFNPDIGIIGNFLSAGGTSRGGSSALAPVPLMTLQESEASFQAVVDPYARADFFLALGEEGVEVEEGLITFPTGVWVVAGAGGRTSAFD